MVEETHPYQMTNTSQMHQTPKDAGASGALKHIGSVQKLSTTNLIGKSESAANL